MSEGIHINKNNKSSIFVKPFDTLLYNIIHQDTLYVMVFILLQYRMGDKYRVLKKGVKYLHLVRCGYVKQTAMKVLEKY